MPDTFTIKDRSEIMRRVKSENTKPEKIVRSLLFSLGYRYRIHKKDLPGKPDIVFPSRKKVIFIHGCFWHSHPNCKRARIPIDNREYWKTKLKRNQLRDKNNYKELEKIGWKYIIVWECEIRKTNKLEKNLIKFLGPVKLNHYLNCDL